MKRNNFITEISEKDFRKLNLIGYKNTRVEVDEHSYRMEMLPVELNKEIDEYKEYREKEDKNTREPYYDILYIAIHTDPTEEDIEDEMKTFTLDEKTGGRRNLTREEAFKSALFNASYLDKWMNQFTGHQTFQIGYNIGHLYSTRDYFECREGYWKVKKSETKAIYKVHLDFKYLEDNKYNIGDSVQINLDMVNDEFKKYDGIYIVKDIKRDSEGEYLYKLNGVPRWGTEEMLIKVE